MKSRRFWLILTVFVAVVLIGLTAVNNYFSRQSPGGSDFVPRWVGVRDYFLKSWSPSSAGTTPDNQTLFYCRPTRPNEDQVLFVYPLYNLVIFPPFAAFSDYVLACAVWMTILEPASIALAEIVDRRLINITLASS